MMRHAARRSLLLAMLALGAARASRAQALPWPAVGSPVAGARVAGRWLWLDLLTPDPAASAAFYGDVFGWQIAAHTAGSAYRVVRADGRAIGGIVAAPQGSRGARWVPLASGDPALMAARARERGGAVLSAPRAAPGRGEMAVLADPDGVPFGVVRVDGGDPADARGGAGEWLWLELWSRAPGQSANFLSAVFGYAVGAGGMADAYHLSAGGHVRAGVMAVPDAALTPAWIPYVHARDLGATLARAQRGGARTVVAPRAHHGSRVAVLVDPQGAPFAIADWRPQ